MEKKYIGLAVACLVSLGLLPGFALASRERNYDDNYRNSDYRGRNYNYDDDRDYRGGYSDRGYQRRNAAAYPDYIPANNYYYADYGYNYGRNYSYGCNCPVACQTAAGQYYYNSAPGARNYTRTSGANYNCPVSYYPACNNANCYSPNYY